MSASKHKRSFSTSATCTGPVATVAHITFPLGLLIELASYRFEPPTGCTHADVMIRAHRNRVARGDHHIDRIHVADAIEELVTASQDSLSEDRSPKDPYRSA